MSLLVLSPLSAVEVIQIVLLPEHLLLEWADGHPISTIS